MKILLFFYLILTSIAISGQSKDGIYSGLLEMCEIDKNGQKDCYDSENPDGKWYHLTYLKIQGEMAYLDMNPILINSKNDTLYSASDGGFFYYKGLVNKAKDSLVLDLVEIYCDNCGEIVEKNEKGEWIPVKRKKRITGIYKDGNLLINGLIFKPEKKDRHMVSENYKPDK